MRSIRGYLLSRLLGGATLVLAAAGIVGYFVVTNALAAQFDSNLTNRVQGFASILFQADDVVTFEFSDELMPEYSPGPEAAYFELWFAEGGVVERSTSLGEDDLEVREPTGDAPRHWTAALPDGRDGRYVSRIIEIHHVYPEEGPDRPTPARILVVVARGRGELAAAERTVLLGCGSVSLVLIALIGVLARRAVDRGLEPANRLAAALGAIKPHRLPARLDAGAMPAELRPVTETIDGLLGRVDAALRRERRTAADIAHELRTPISELLTVAEVALRNGHDPAGAERALAAVRDVAGRMGRSVSTLLKLARLDMGAETFTREPVDLGELLEEVRISLAALERERALRFEVALPADGQVRADREALRIIVTNLLGNAFSYAPAAGRVECRLRRSPQGWLLLVGNETEDLEADDLPALSAPFWRKDGARADRESTGLGLALSLALAERAGMELRFELQDRSFSAVLAGRDGDARGTASA